MKRRERKEKNLHHREDLLGLPSWDITTAIARDPCQEFYKEKLPGEIHNLFLTSAAQLTNDSKAFSSVTSPTDCEEVGGEGGHLIFVQLRPAFGWGWLLTFYLWRDLSCLPHACAHTCF